MLRLIKSLTSPAVKRAVITTGLEVSAILDAIGLAGGMRGRGAIFTLHHVRALFQRPFHPNDILEVTPAFLDEALATLKARGYDFIRLEELPERLASASRQPFACFTLDDGNRNNKTDAAPVFTKHNAPFTIFLTKGFIEGTHSLWWETLEALLNKVPALDFDFGLGPEPIPTATPAQKLAAFRRITDFVATTDETRAVEQLDAEARRHGIDPLAITRDLTMRADELRGGGNDRQDGHGICLYLWRCPLGLAARAANPARSRHQDRRDHAARSDHPRNADRHDGAAADLVQRTLPAGPLCQGTG
jgi:peptidoglycan/xylan/chitin deacetylase (PgdA/CDA1 family)